MTYEDALLSANIALVIATTVLGVSTYRLFRATAGLRDTTRQLALLEERRDRREKLEGQYARLDTKLRLAIEVVRLEPRVMVAYLSGASEWVGVHAIQALSEVMDYESDRLKQNDLERVLLALDNAKIGEQTYGLDKAQEVATHFQEKVQDVLRGDLFKWREQLRELSNRILLTYGNGPRRPV